MRERIVCGCLLDHQVVNPLFTLLCAFPSWVVEGVCASGLYPSSCEVILAWLSANPSSCEVIILLDWSLPQGGGCGCKERSWVLLMRVLCGLASGLEILRVSKVGM